MVLNPADPGGFFILLLMVAITLTGAYFFIREIIADAIALADKRKKQREGRWEDPREHQRK